LIQRLLMQSKLAAQVEQKYFQNEGLKQAVL
jgi:hypothetical protein